VTTRREFIHAWLTALGAASGPRLGSASYELLIKGGRVLDASQRLDRVMDVAIAAGRIARLDANIARSEAADVIDAGGKIVTPGLIDIHAHLSREMLPAHCLSTGVTSLVDGGSSGADNAEEIVSIARSAPNRMRVLLNLARTGLATPNELLDFANADAAAARRVIESHRDIIVGIKARLSRSVAGERDLDAIRRAHEVTIPLNLPLMVHVGQTASPMPAIVAALRPGDIVTHVYSPPPNSILDDAGRVLDEVRAARRRGIWFDIGNGRNGHITWEVAERAMQQDFLPDTISSDLTAAGRTDRVFDFPTVLSKFLLLGMPIDQVIARATSNAARAMPVFKDLGTLRVGAPADVAVFEIKQGEFEFVDNLNVKRIGRQKLAIAHVIAAGASVPGFQGSRVPRF
jgi:dihydroorotase